MGQEGSELDPCRDEIIPQDGEDTCADPGHMHSDVTMGFSSQWKHGVHFTVRAAQSLFLADPVATLPPLLPAPVHNSPGCPLRSTPHSTMCSFVMHALPIHLWFVCSLIPLLTHSLIQQTLFSNHYVPGTILGDGDTAVRKISCAHGTCV